MSTAPDRRKALGKGLSALLPSRTAAAPTLQPVPAAGAARERTGPVHLPIAEIQPNPQQPRTVFEPDRLEELAQSIRANGIIQPLIVRQAGNHYEIVAGERRWRAAKLAGLAEVPVIVQEFAQERLLELALIENIQREDLNPIEAAHAFDRLNREMGLSHEEIGRRTGKDRSSIANFVRLLKLPQRVQELVGSSQLPMGHARAILGLNDPDRQAEVAELSAKQGMSTRQVESLVRHLTLHGHMPGAKPAVEKAEPKPVDPNVKAAIEQLERVLGTRVRIVEQSQTRGRIEIEYYSQDELNRLYTQIVGEG